MAYKNGVAGTAIIDNGNVAFKLGLQANLDTIATNSTAVNGTFYLTSDTHRLYVGDKEGNVCPVNEGVITVASINNLPATGVPGQFYYVTAENILCVYNGQKWAQINTDTTLSSVKNYVASGAGGVSVQTTVVDTSNATGVNDTFTIKGGSGITVSADAATSNNKGLTISADIPEYTLDVTATEVNSAIPEIVVNLQKDGTNVAETLTLAAGSNIAFTSDASGKISIAANVDATTGQVTKAAFSNNATAGFDLTLTRTNSAALVGNLNPTIKVGADGAETSVSFVGGAADLPVYTSAQVDAKLKELEYELNAMVYKGAVPSTSQGSVTTYTLPSGEDKVSIGDVYMLTGSGVTVGGSGSTETYDAGTLFVATAAFDTTENADGYLPADAITWTIVQNYNTDTQYVFTASSEDNSAKLSIQKKVGENLTGAGGLEVVGDNAYLTVTGLSTSNNTVEKVTVSHKTKDYTGKVTTVTVPAADPTKYIYEGKVIKEVAYDTAGHITGYTEALLQVSNNTLKLDANNVVVTDGFKGNVNGTAGASGDGEDVAKQTTTIGIYNGGAKANSINITHSISSSTLQIAKTTDGFSMNLAWGTF